MRGGRATIAGLMPVKVLGRPILESQLQVGRLYPECIAGGSRRMRDGFRRWHEGFADLADILSGYIKGFSPLFFLHLPPVIVCFLDQHVAFPLPDGDEAVLGFVFIVVLHLNVDLSRGNRQIRHDASNCPPGSSPQEEDVYEHGFMGRPEKNKTNKQGSK